MFKKKRAVDAHVTAEPENKRSLNEVIYHKGKGISLIERLVKRVKEKEG